jgi:hypothetical protein
MGGQRGPGLLDASLGEVPFAAGDTETAAEAIPVPFQPALPGELPGQPEIPELA